MKVTIRYRCEGHKDLDMILYSSEAVKHLTQVLIKFTEERLPRWAEIMYFGLKSDCIE